MLAQNFLDAKALGLTEEQREALIKTLGAFERGEIKDENFNMREWAEIGQCRTVGCIGGWAELIGGLGRSSLNRASFDNSELTGLFYPETLEASVCCDIEKGAHALRNYLTTGYARWEEVFS